MAKAQEMLKQGQRSVQQGTIGSTQETSAALERVEASLASQARKAPDLKSEKALTDMAILAGTAEQLVSEKDMGDRLQRITKEADLATQEVKMETSGMEPVRTEEFKHQAQRFIDDFGPLFQLITSSHEFRSLVVRFIKIARRVFLRSTQDKDIGRLVESEWLRGTEPAQIAKLVKSEAKDSVTNAEGDVEVLITDDELDQLQDEFLRLLAVIAQEPTYRAGINRLLDMSDMVYEEGGKAKDVIKTVTRQTHAQKLKHETKELVAQFTTHETLEDFLDSFGTLVDRLRDDEETKRYLQELREFILETKSPEVVQSEDFKIHSKDLVKRGRKLIDEFRYSAEVDRFLDCSDAMLQSLKNDETVAKLREHAGIVAQDLTYEDANGNRQLDMQVLSSIRKVIVPVIADALKYIPIPKIEECNNKQEYTVDNIVLCGYDIIPENVFVHLESDTWVNVRELETDESKTRLVIKLKNIRTEFKDLQFYYKRKQFPKMEESGRVTIRMGGKGGTLTTTFYVNQRPQDTVPKFTSGIVDFDIDQLDFDFDRSTLSHDVLVPMITSLFKANIIHTIEKGVQKYLGSLVNDIGNRLSSAIAGWEPRLAKQLEFMKQGMKKGEFAHTYRKRQEKLE